MLFIKKQLYENYTDHSCIVLINPGVIIIQNFSHEEIYFDIDIIRFLHEYEGSKLALI
jgi:hypothetical protein